MSRGNLLRLAATVAILAGWVFVGGGAKYPEVVSASSAGPIYSSGQPPQLSAEGDMCQWEPARTGGTTAAALLTQASANAPQARGSDENIRTVDFSQRKPIRKIHDSYSAFSSVAVDPVSNEVVFTDENLFSILTYDRLTNTPATATMSEPKRRIGGLKTDIEFQCALYIDPKSGDIYAVNNDTQGRLVIFSRQANGDVPPNRHISTPDGTFGIAVNEEHQELLLSLQHPNAVVTYRKMASGDEAPIRLLQGDRTLLADPHGMALDSKHDIIFVTNHGSVHSVTPSPRRKTQDPNLPMTSDYRRGFGKEFWPVGYNFAIEESIPGSGRNLPPSITVYARDAAGDTPPLRIIRGPKTRLNWPTALAYDPRTDELFVANDMLDEVLVFNATADGDVAPIRMIKGPKSRIKNPTGIFLDLEHDELWVANFGNHTATVYKSSASGDAPPLRIIRTGPEKEPTLMIGNARIAYDTKREEVLVPN